jgi:vacuolar-type H+-ATPase subunit F/Vma7
MSRDLVVIADELDAVGFRLAGVDTLTPAPRDVDAAFANACATTAGLVVVGRRLADALAPGVLARATAAGRPLVAVLPEVVAPAPDAAFERRMRGVLGIES